MKDNILYAVGVWGEGAGIILITLVSVWDLLIFGLRSFMEYRIGIAGIIAIWIGVGLILASKHLDSARW